MTTLRLRSFLIISLALVLSTGLPSVARAYGAGASATADNLSNALLTAMKGSPPMDFAARRGLLAPEIQRDLDLAVMTRLVVGPSWHDLGPDERQKLVDAFSAYSIATYAQRFDSYSGERFEVDPSPTVLPKGDCIVRTKLFTSDPQPVQLDYLMRKSDDRWRIIDVYLNGTISEMAARRSEYSAVLRQGGVVALIDLLKKKTADLAGQRPGSS
ncbi:MAG: ABC transporter substrate-binding protein [Opitutaceae bacterium]|jgi:phospholipid transport system substrate-binding protein